MRQNVCRRLSAARRRQKYEPGLTHQRKYITPSPLFARCTSKFLPLPGKKLKDIQDIFNNVDIGFIDEKSMIGQKIFTVVSKRLQEARPHYNDKPFGNVLVVLLWDFNQRPPVCDSLLLYCLVLYWLFKANTVNSS